MQASSPDPSPNFWDRLTQWTGLGLAAVGITTTALGGGLVMGSGFLAWLLMPGVPPSAWTNGNACMAVTSVLLGLAGSSVGAVIALFGLGLSMPGGAMWFAVWWGQARARRNKRWNDTLD